MGYFIRVLSQTDQNVALSEIRREITGGSVEPADVVDDDWSSFTIRDATGRWIAEVTRDIVTAGSPAEEELAELRESLEEQEPKSGSDWARAYLTSVKTIYALQINTSVIDSDGWRYVQSAKDAIRTRAGGLIQADNEGFSNAEGEHITWDFPNSVSGAWWMAVRQDDAWITFQMELGNPEHRAAFKAGRVPAGVTPSK